ncbi:MAG: XRE family transcriptional regulator [Bacteroidales bacterium]|nr:XRE family transcriptional regulator [Bacteroidales bacterium]
MKSEATPNGFHIGRAIKQELARQGRTAVWLARQVNCSRENLYKLFMRQWINTDLLFQISKALGHDFFEDCTEFYREGTDNYIQPN